MKKEQNGRESGRRLKTGGCNASKRRRCHLRPKLVANSRITINYDIAVSDGVHT
jgi:hypothetical protein